MAACTFDDVLEPTSAQEVAETLRSAAGRQRRIRTGGRFTKRLMAGPNDANPGIVLSTAKLDRVLQYEPRDLTVSVQAGMPWRKLQRVLAANNQMIPLDPIYADHATVGGTVSANISGPRRRQYGTARDLIIGMQFATLNGRLVNSGGMVVKNVAGLDMGKLMIGAFGTLSVITVVNFKLSPLPPAEQTFLVEFPTAAAALLARDQLIRGVVQPGAIDLMNPVMAATHGLRGWTLMLWFAGNEALIARCEKLVDQLAGSVHAAGPAFWDAVSATTPRFLEKFTEGAIVRVSCLLTEVGAVMEELDVPSLARAGTGVVHGYFSRADAASKWVVQAAARGRKVVIEFAPEDARAKFELWPSPGSDFAIMRKIKQMFDPESLLNRGRLYRHL